MHVSIFMNFVIRTLFVSRQTPIIVPSFDKYHVISQIFSLNLGLLKDYYIGFKDVKHSSEGLVVPPWLILKGITNAIDLITG